MTTTGVKMTEKQLSDAVSELARLMGWLGYHTHDSRRSAAGFPDWVFIRGDRLLFVELKSATGRLRPDQETWLAALRVNGRVETFLWTPARWLDGTIEQVLR